MDFDIETTDAPRLVEASACAFNNLPVEIHDLIVDYVLGEPVVLIKTKTPAGRAAKTWIATPGDASLALVSCVWRVLIQRRLFSHSMSVCPVKRLYILTKNSLREGS